MEVVVEGRKGTDILLEMEWSVLPVALAAGVGQ